MNIHLSQDEIDYLLSLLPPSWNRDTPQEIVKLKNKLNGIDNTRKSK